MKLSCEQVQKQLGKAKTLTLVDGNKLIKKYAMAQKTVVKGDAKSASIAAASILAKVSRDRFMDELTKISSIRLGAKQGLSYSKTCGCN